VVEPPRPTSIARGALLTVSMRWASRLIGVVSTLILARLLLPEDFGVAAMASVVLGLATVLLDVGVNVALVRNKNAEPAHYHAAWTLRVIQGLLVGATLLAVAPYAGDYFGDTRVPAVLALMALTVLVGSFENIGIVTFQKEMNFAAEFRYLLANRLFGFVCTVALAFWLRNYWALAFGSLAGAVFGMLNSYRVHPMRPRASMRKLGEIFSVSQWMLVQNIGNYVDNSLHSLLVGRRDGAAVMGAYALSDELASVPSTEVLQPLNRVLFPAFVAIKDDLARLKYVFLLAQSIQTAVVLPAAVFLSLLAADLVPVLLGPKWSAAVPLLATLAIGSALRGASASAWYVGVTLGHERRSALLAWGLVSLFLVLAFVVFPTAGAQRIAQLRVAVLAVGLLVQLLIVARALGNVTMGEMMRGVWRSVASVVVAAAVAELLSGLQLGVWASLLGKLLACTIAYVLVHMVLWVASGRPDGPERFLLDNLRPLAKRVRARLAGMRPHRE